VVKAVAVVLLAGVAVRLGDILIRRCIEEPSAHRDKLISDGRRKTLVSLLRSVVRYSAGAVVIIAILDLAGIDTRALLGGAAILGVAVGFGAQNLVRDIITGFFIIYERQYDVGDYVSASGVSGVVEEVGLRTTRLRDWNGDVHIIPNGLIDKTTNKSLAGSRALVDVTLDHDSDVRKAIEVMQSVCDQIAKEYPVITDGPKVLGVSNINLAGVVIQVWARTKPLEQYEVQRELLLRIIEALQGAGISPAKLPYAEFVGKE